MTTATVTSPHRSAASYAPPRMTADQRRAALGHANTIRSWRASMKQSLKKSRNPYEMAADLVRDPPEELKTMKVTDFAMAIPKVGRERVRMLLFATGMSHSKTIGGMSHRQRHIVVEWCHNRCRMERG